MSCAARDISAGEEVLHTYGDLSDAELLQTYGFIEHLDEPANPHHNPHNNVSVSMNLVQSCCEEVARSAQADCSTPSSSERLQHLQQWLGEVEEGMKITADDPLPEQLIAAMQVRDRATICCVLDVRGRLWSARHPKAADDGMQCEGMHVLEPRQHMTSTLMSAQAAFCLH